MAKYFYHFRNTKPASGGGQGPVSLPLSSLPGKLIEASPRAETLDRYNVRPYGRSPKTNVLGPASLAKGLFFSFPGRR
jgi:hypothetical protein